MILVIAQNPKIHHNLENPLIGTKSYQTFMTWCTRAGMTAEDFYIINAASKFGTVKMGDVDLNQMRAYVDKYGKIICLGKFAEKAVKRCDIQSKKILFLPHPSGLNRILNDQLVVDEIVARLTAFK